MSNLIQRCLYLSAIAVLCFGTSALADNFALEYIGGTFPGSSTGPYNVLLNGSPRTMVCDDNETSITYNESWQASATSAISIAGGGPTPTTFVDLNPAGTNFQLNYEEVAWLALQMYDPANADLTDETNLQNAIWDIMSGSGTMSGAALSWQSEALSAVQAGGVDYSDVTFYTYIPGTPVQNQVSGPGPNGTIEYDPPQEFVSVTPEPPTATLFGSLLGLMALIAAFRRVKAIVKVQ